jgi:hypothetical protein
MIRLLVSTALGLVLANAAFAQAPNANTTTQQSAPSQDKSQDKSAAPSTTSPSGTAQSQQTTSQPQQSSTSAPSAQNAQSTAPSSTSPGSGTNAANNADNSSRPQSGTANSSTTNPPATQQGANPPATNQAQDRSNQPPANTNQAQQAPGANGANQAQQAPTNNQAQGARTDTNAQVAGRTDVKLDRQQETKISASVSHLNVRPLTNVNFSLSVGTVVPRDVQLSTLPPDVVEIVPQYRGYSFALVKDEIVIVDPATYKIVTVLPYSGQSTATTTSRERSASKFSDRDREVIRKHVKARPERSETRTTGSTARTEIHIGDRVPDSVEVEEFPNTVYQDAPTLRDYRYIHRDTRTYVVEPHERRVIEEID